MADRSCNYCQDNGDCVRCSPFFEPDKAHSACGRPWRDHATHVQPGQNQGIYPPWATCPANGRLDPS